jgi:hypothetical protein
MNNLGSEPESFDTENRKGVYLVPRLENYGGFGCGITFTIADGDRLAALWAGRDCPDNLGVDCVLVAPIYLGDAYTASNPHFAIAVMHEFSMLCCEQHELFD